MEKKLPDFDLNGTNLVQMVWQRRLFFIVIGIVAFVSSLVVSLLITPQFKSTAILIPATATQASKDVFVPSRAKGFTVFGDDEEVEHLLQVLSSETLRRNIILKLNLFEHYGIHPNESHAWHKVNETYDGNISFRPSRYRSVRIEVYDNYPEMAATLANSIVQVADSLMRATKREVAQKALDVLEMHYQLALSDAYATDDSLTRIMRNGVLNLTYQTKEFTKTYSQAIASGNNNVAQKIKKEFEILADNGALFTRYIYEIQYRSLQLKDMHESIQILRAEAQGAIPSQFVIDWAYPSDKKAKPKKAVIVIASTLAALFFSVFLFVLVDFFRTSLMPTVVAKE